MARRRNRGGGASVAQGPVTSKTGDSFQNLVARTGLGTANQNSASSYGFSPISRNHTQMEFVYRSSWIAGQAVDVFAQDMTREWVEIKGDVKPDVIEKLNKATTRLKLRNAICDTIKWSRLYGGCLAVMMIDGQKTDTPLRLDTIGKDQFKGLMVLDRWVLQPDLTDLITDLGPDIGKPKFYTVIADAQALVNMKIHYSRVVRLDGVDLPYWQRIAENGWGQSVLERLWDRLVPFDSATQGAAQLVYKAHLRTYKVDGLREIIAVGGKAFEGLVKQIEMIRTFQTNEGITLMDGKDEFETHAYSFAGLSDMLMQFGQQISGALGIPLVRLFGQSPAGLSSTGESDIRNYYDNVSQEQEANLRDGLLKIYGALYRSEVGEEPPDNFDIEFRPLWQMSDKEKAEVAESIGRAVSQATNDGTIDRATALKELRQSAQITGVFTNITDDDITQAENEPPPDMGELGLGGPDDENTNARPKETEVAEQEPESGAALQQAA